MERISYKLRFPIAIRKLEAGTAKTVEIKELSLAPRVKGIHMRATDGARGPVEAKLMLIAALSGLSRDEADELDEVDVMAIDDLYGDAPPPLGDGASLSDSGPATGASSSGD